MTYDKMMMQRMKIAHVMLGFMAVDTNKLIVVNDVI